MNELQIAITELQGKAAAHQLVLNTLLQHNPAALQFLKDLDPTTQTFGFQLPEEARRALWKEVEFLAQTRRA